MGCHEFAYIAGNNLGHVPCIKFGLQDFEFGSSYLPLLERPVRSINYCPFLFHRGIGHGCCIIVACTLRVPDNDRHDYLEHDAVEYVLGRHVRIKY